MPFCGDCGRTVHDRFCEWCGARNPHHVEPTLRAGEGVGPPDLRDGALAPSRPQVTRGFGWVPSPDATTAPAPIVTSDSTRRWLVLESQCVLLAFLLPVVTSAVVLLAQHVSGVGGVTRFPQLVNQPVANLLIGILAYSAVGALVPLALLLLARSGQSRAELGLAIPGLRSDVLPALGIGVLAFLGEIAVLSPLAPLIKAHKSLLSKVPIGHVPSYYVIWGLAISAITAITEEVLMNGYLMTRLEQFGWGPGRALTLAVVLRTSYHVYYGVGFLLTIPFSILATRSFQKHHRLTRPIVAHFLFDAILLTIAILA